MSNKLNRLFKNITELDPPAELKGIILNRIELERNKLFRAELFLSRVVFAGSLFILLYTSFAFGRAIIDSEFWRIASLAVSDLGTIVNNWQEFAYSLLETLPVFNFVAILLPLFALLLSFNFYSTLNSKHHEHQKINSI